MERITAHMLCGNMVTGPKYVKFRVSLEEMARRGVLRPYFIVSLVPNKGDADEMAGVVILEQIERELTRSGLKYETYKRNCYRDCFLQFTDVILIPIREDVLFTVVSIMKSHYMFELDEDELVEQMKLYSDKCPVLVRLFDMAS